MSDLNVRITGGKLVRRGLQNLAAAVPQIGRQQIYNAVRRIRARMRQEPGRVEGYSRTGQLRGSWIIVRVADGYNLYNVAVGPYGQDYPQYVVGDSEGANQAWMHQGRWPLFRDEVDEEISQLPPEIERHIQVSAAIFGF